MNNIAALSLLILLTGCLGPALPASTPTSPLAFTATMPPPTFTPANSPSPTTEPTATFTATPISPPSPTPAPPPPPDGISIVPGFAVAVFAEGLSKPTSLAFAQDGRLFVAEAGGRILILEDVDGSGFAESQKVFADFAGQPLGIAFRPATGELYAPDNEVDDLGPDLPPEELNRIVEGGDYGWPYCYGQNLPNPNFPPKTSCVGKTPPLAEMEAHSSADGMVFYSGQQFPAEFRNNLFVALWGSWSYLTDPPTGRKVVRIILPPSGSSPLAMVSNFMTGLGNPLDLAVVPEGQPLAGQLLIADYGAGKIYRVWAVG